MDGTYDGVTIANAKRANTDTTYVELNKGGSASFSVSAGAKVTIAVGSTSSSNTSTYTITGGGLDKSDESVVGTSYAATDLGTATQAGTVTIAVPSSAARGMRIKTITVTY